METNKNEVSGRIPKSVVRRLSLYLRELQRLLRSQRETISSTELGKLLGLTDAQVRKDFAYFGQFGFPGVGYRCEPLAAEIRRILGTDQTWPVVLIGCGNLGQALLGYRGFQSQGFSIQAALDIDSSVVGGTFGELTVQHLDRLEERLAGKNFRVGIIAVPAAAAQSVAQRLVHCGVTGILNFAPITLDLPPAVRIIVVDLAIELEQLSYAVVNEMRKG